MRTALRALLVSAIGLFGCLFFVTEAAWAESPTNAHVKEYTLFSPAIHVGAYQTVRVWEAAPSPGIDGYVVRMNVRVVDASTGAEIPQYQLMLHHILVSNRGSGNRSDGACPDHKTGEKFYGTAEELRELDLPAGYGYPTAAADKWRVYFMLMNHVADPRVVKIRYDVRVDTSRLTPVKPYWLSVVACSHSASYTVPGSAPPGSTDAKAAAWTVPVTGRIVAVAGHLHGGSRSLTLGQPRCRSTLLASQPTYAPPNDPLYRVSPLIHEPDPKDISFWRSQVGIPVVQGEKLLLTANYDGRWPHMRVMGIMHLYIAADPGAGAGCRQKPNDAEVLGPNFDRGRTDPPHSNVGLAAMGPGGGAHPIDRPPGATTTSNGGASVSVSHFNFGPRNLSIPAGASVTWKFEDAVQHDVTLVDGPRGFASPYEERGGQFRQTFTVPGTYRINCSLHPTRMPQLITVRGK